MNDTDIFGGVICNVKAPKLVRAGIYSTTKVKIKKFNILEDKQDVAERDSEHLLETLDDNDINKSLICARSTKQIVRLFSESNFAHGT